MAELTSIADIVRGMTFDHEDDYSDLVPISEIVAEVQARIAQRAVPIYPKVKDDA